VAAGEQHGHGELAVPDERDLPDGSVVTASGRVSAAEHFREPPADEHPFTPIQLSRLDEALTLATRDTGLRFSLYLGDLGQNPPERVADLHDGLPDAADAVLVAVSPEQRVVEVLTGPAARLRLPDRGAKLAVMSMVASFKEGDLFSGLLSGLRMLADQAGGRPGR
jgi:Domain of unknown function (DUF5130)